MAQLTAAKLANVAQAQPKLAHRRAVRLQPMCAVRDVFMPGDASISWPLAAILEAMRRPAGVMTLTCCVPLAPNALHSALPCSPVFHDDRG